MTTRVCKSKMDVTDVCKLLQSMKLPITVNVVKGKNRSNEQNRLQQMWHLEAAEQLQDETAEQKRGYCKLHFGVPILRAENPKYREKYDRLIRPYPYEHKIELMMVPLDFPVSRLMTTGQCKRFLDEICDYYTNLGVQLTMPEDV